MPLPAPRPPGSFDSRLFLGSGALFGLLTVLLGALAAHLPEAAFAPNGRALLRTQVEMQGWHLAALLATGLLIERQPGRGMILLRLAGWCFLLGLCAFCAGLSALAFWGSATLAHLAPVGGSVLMLGWLLLLLECLRR
ncbi:DUF423 domain-containing protein [Acetobacteraceae bacterium KSS8]|uniref:DUF423 domain-containing protein n=1 Tax=Endosaccharibacter trunci TaxID=2812733 RepID=A0ABT1W4Y6_9PROT|nr:DUF423 domain-containing protein [Acetobacteraceae bacterium KSS8]